MVATSVLAVNVHNRGVQRAAAAIFVNEGAGSAHSSRVRRAVELTQRAFDADMHVTATRDAAELEAWMHDRLDGYATIVIVGGDGSLGVGYNAVAGRDVTLGYIPAGFGNATAHLLRLPREPEAMAATIARADARSVDLMAVGDRLALFAGAGWDAQVARRYADEGARRLLGWGRAVVESMPALFRRPSVRVTADGLVVHEGPMELLVVGTTPFYGRGLHVNPGARPDIGQLTLRVYAGPAPRLALEAVRWVAHRPPRAVAHRAVSVRLESLDGRPLGVQADGDALGDSGEWRFDVRPRAVKLIGRW
jgi:diacylglycerol kinase (ATP)